MCCSSHCWAAGDRQQTIDRYKPLLAKAKELGFEIEADVNPMMFERMGINASFFHGPLDLSFFTELQVDILRLDLGLNDMEEAFLSKNKEGIKICVNGWQHSGSCGSCTGCRR